MRGGVYLNAAFCVYPLTLIDFNTKRVQRMGNSLRNFSNASEVSSTSDLCGLVQLDVLYM